MKYEIPLPLLDRMEIIELSSYLDIDKLEIAKRHLIPRLKKEYGLEEMNIEFRDEAILKIIREYTREAGVRNVEREIASIFRKLAKNIVQDYDKKRNKRKNAPERRQSLYKNPNFKKSIKNIIARCSNKQKGIASTTRKAC